VRKRSTFEIEDIVPAVVGLLIIIAFWHMTARSIWIENLSLTNLNPPILSQCVISDWGTCILESGRTLWNYNTDLRGIVFTHTLALAIPMLGGYVSAWVSPYVSIRLFKPTLPIVEPVQSTDLYPAYTAYSLTSNDPYASGDPREGPKQAFNL
jgi:hypothetical protein